MIFGDIVNVFIALALTFAMIGLVVSAIAEGIASALRWRSTTLLQGIKDLLNDQDLSGLAGEVLAHAAANPLAPGDNTATAAGPEFRPSYIAPNQFAVALIDSVQTWSQRQPGAAATNLQGAIAKIPDDQIRTLLSGMYARANGNLDKLQDEIANWFDSAMDRVSGVYKRWSQLITVILAMIIAVALNVSAFHVAFLEWGHPDIAIHLDQLPTSTANATDALRTLKQADFPYGWHKDELIRDFSDFSTRPFEVILNGVLLLVGWLATAIATLFGAPFWFDSLQRFVKLGGAGPKPDGKPAP